MKKFLSILLCVAMLVSCVVLLTACGKDDEVGKTPATIVGDWEAEFDFGAIMEELMFSADTEVPEEYKEWFDFSGLCVTMCISFYDEDTYEVGFDEDSVEDMIDDLLDMLSESMKKVMEQMLESQDMTLDEYLTMMGTTWDEVIKETFPRSEIKDSFYDMEDTTGTYRMDGNKLYFDDEEDEYTEFTLTADKLSFTKVVGMDLDDENVLSVLGKLLPLEFTRKK